MASVVVLGAGIVGLSTAQLLRNELPDSSNVTLIASKFLSQTTSYGAAGIYRMDADIGLAPPDKLNRWLALSYERYLTLARGANAPLMGANLLKLYQYFDTPQFNRPLHSQFCLNYRELEESELRALHLPEPCKSGCVTTTVMVEPRRYLPHLMSAFRRGGGQIVQREVASFSELKDFDLVVNCTGAGARELCEDEKMYQVRGHMRDESCARMRRCTQCEVR